MYTIDSALGYFQSQLQHVEARVFEKKFRPIVYAELFPVSFEAGEYATSIAYHFMASATKGKFIGSAGDDIPFVNTEGGRAQIPVEYAGIGYEYTLEEIRQAEFLGIPLSARQAIAARRGYEEHAQSVAFFGDAARGMKGFLSNSDVTAASAITGTWSNPARTPDEILGDINGAITAQWDATNGVEIADTVLVPLPQFGILANRRVSSQSDTTILEYVKQKNVFTAQTGQPLMIRGLSELAGLGAGATDRMMVYSRSEEVAVFHIPLPLRFQPPQAVNLKIRVPGEYKLAGAEFRFPGAARYADGI